MLVFFVGSLFLLLPQSNFLYDVFTTLKKFQFPWRFLSLSLFALAVISSSSLLLIKNISYKKYAVIIIAIFLFFQSLEFINVKGYFTKPEDYYTGIYKSTTDTGESSPIWSIRFMEKEPNSHLEIIEGDATISEIKRSSTRHEYDIQVKSAQARIKDNTVYFPGWKVFILGNEVPVEFQDQLHRGLITFYAPQGNHNIIIEFKDTRLRMFANYVSVAGFVILISGYLFIVKRK